MIRTNIRAFVSRFGHSGRILNKRQTAQFCSQLKMMLSSGMPLLEALQVIQGLEKKGKMGKMIASVIDGVYQGLPLSESAVDLLPPMATGLIRAAERVGNLEATLARLAKYYDDKANLDEKIIGAMVYPCFIMVLSLLSVLVLLVFVLPGIKSLFVDLGAELPLMTSIILGVSDIFSNSSLVLLGVVLAAALIIARVRKIERKKYDEYLLRLPLFGKLSKQELAINGFGTLGALLSGGTPLVEALNITANSVRNIRFKELIQSARDQVENGAKLSDALADGGFFPEATIQMLQVGENSGQLAEMLANIAGFQASEREHSIKRFTTLLEPAMMLTVGLVVGVIVLAMFLPLINMISSLQ